MRYIERYIKTLTDNIIVNESKVKNSKSKYYILNNGFKIRLSDHLSPLPTKMQKCALNIIQDFNNKEAFIVTINMQPMPIIMDRKQVKQYIEVLYTNYRLQHYFEENIKDDDIDEDIPIENIQIPENKKVKEIKESQNTLKLENVISKDIVHYLKVIKNIKNANMPTTKQLGKAITEICNINEFNIKNSLQDIQSKLELLPGIELQDYTDDGKVALYETFYESRYPQLPGMIKIIGCFILSEYLKNKNPNSHYPKNKNTVYTALQQLIEMHKDLMDYIKLD